MERYVWHYLHNASLGCSPVTRIDSGHVGVVLENVISGVGEYYALPFDERDRRTLVAFDGYLLAGSANRKGARILDPLPVGTLEIPKGQFFAPASDELGIAPYRIRTSLQRKEFVSLEIYRHFLLLRAGTFVFAGYDAKNLAPRYLIALVRKGGKRGEWVEWLVGG